jgi:hypothetical protein
MNSILSAPDEVQPPNVREPPSAATGEDVREPPLPSNNGSKDDLPSEDEKIDPDDGGGTAPRRASAAELQR